MKQYETPEFELISFRFYEDMLVTTTSVEGDIPDAGDDW